MILKENIIGERIYLRALDQQDASDDYASWLNDPEVNKFLATKSATKESLADYIQKKNEQSDALFLGIIIKAGDKHIGTIKLEPIDSKLGKTVIAIMVGDKANWGKGYGGEAMEILMEYAKNNLNIDTVELGVVAQNVTAMNAYAKLGFIEVNREYGTVHYDNNDYDQVTMIRKFI